MNIPLSEQYAFVRKGAGVQHIARRNKHTNQPIHLTECSYTVGTGLHRSGSEWPSITQTADTDIVCKKCARSVFGFRWDSICRGSEAISRVDS